LKNVTINLSYDKAESISNGLSDILCWVDGFIAGRAGTDLSGSGPMGVERARDMNIALKWALDETDKRNPVKDTQK
jgi:hypothetical protein